MKTLADVDVPDAEKASLKVRVGPFPNPTHTVLPKLVTVCPYIAIYTTATFFVWYQEMCKTVHSSVRELSEEYLATEGRHNYVTPTSYLELLTMFTSLLRKQRETVSGQKRRYEVGLEKVRPCAFPKSRHTVLPLTLVTVRTDSR